MSVTEGGAYSQLHCSKGWDGCLIQIFSQFVPFVASAACNKGDRYLTKGFSQFSLLALMSSASLVLVLAPPCIFQVFVFGIRAEKLDQLRKERKSFKTDPR